MSDDKKISVIVIDDHLRVHQALTEIIDFCDDIELIAHGSNGLEAIELCDLYHPDIVIMDVLMPVLDGVEATRRIKEKHPDIKILALSSFADQETTRKMLQNGASGYILKDSTVNDIEHAIRTAAKGQSVLSSEVVIGLVQESGTTPTADYELTERQLEVVKLLADGLTQNEVANRLHISVSTVKFHITNIQATFGVDTLAEVLVHAAKHNLI